jgi:hypothetical protein
MEAKRSDAIKRKPMEIVGISRFCSISPTWNAQ